MQWLYIKDQDREYCYELNQNSEKFFLKDLGVCFDLKTGKAEKKNVQATILSDFNVMYQVKKGEHQLLKPSYWLNCIKIIPILWIIYFLFTINTSFAKSVNLQDIERNILEKNYLKARDNIHQYEMYVNTQNPVIAEYKFKVDFAECQSALKLRSWQSIESTCKDMFYKTGRQKQYARFFKLYQTAVYRLFLEAYLIEPYHPIAAFNRYKVLLKICEFKHPLHKKSLKRLHAMQQKD